MSDPVSPGSGPPGSPLPEPANLRFLRRLVTTLTAVMICGLVVIVALLVIRFSRDTAPQLPDKITLPAGTTAVAITAAPGWYAVVTADDRLLVYRQGSGELLRDIPIGSDNE